MNDQTSTLKDAALESVTGGGKIGEAAQQVSGLSKVASDIGRAAHIAVCDCHGFFGGAL
jgi:hypothetical protein